MKKTLIIAGVAATFTSAAYAQSSVTLYGVVDAGVTYVSNEANNNAQNGKAAVGVTSGNVEDSRWGLRGVEDLGGGFKALFNVESGFNAANGQMSNASSLFNRQATVGVYAPDYGTITAGRQYDSVVDYLAPLSATGSWGGTYFAHRGDNDNMNATVSLNNSVKFQSDNYAGFSFNGAYAFSNQAGGFAQNRAYSAGMGYDNAGLKLGAAYLQMQGLDSGNTKGAIEGVPASTAAALPGVQNQRTWGVGGSYTFGPAIVGAVFTQTRLQSNLSDISVRFNNYEVNARYNLTPALGLGAAYTYMQAKSSSSSDVTGHWNQIGLQADYSLSKRTDVYLEGVTQLGANNAAGMSMTQVNGTDAASTSRNQVVVSSGIRHRF